MGGKFIKSAEGCRMWKTIFGRKSWHDQSIIILVNNGMGHLVTHRLQSLVLKEFLYFYQSIFQN